MSADIVELPNLKLAADRLRIAQRRAELKAQREEERQAQGERKPTPRNRKVARHPDRPPTPTFGEHILTIDTAGGKQWRHPVWAYRAMLGSLVLEWLLRRGDIELRRSPPYGPYRGGRYMTDRLLKRAIIETSTIIFCRNGRVGLGPPEWLPQAVRLAVFRRPSKHARSQSVGK
jgi:hypothetical protein